MIDRARLLADLQRLLRELEDDLRERAREQKEVEQTLRAEHARAKESERTSLPFETWLEEFVTQVAVAWILAAVFVRFLEDNDLVAEPKIAGSGDRLDRARDHQQAFLLTHLECNDRHWLLAIFDEVALLPGMAPLFDRRHNPLYVVGPSADGAKHLLEFFRARDGATDAPVHDFTDPAFNTRFLGDLYQELSESAKKRFALLQTPEFIEEFILDRTLEPACAEFGFENVKLIDPTCGSGHFLLGAFPRLLNRWQKKEPGTNVRVLVQRTLDAIHGVDVNPFATAIARFRMLVAALAASGVKRLKDAPDFKTGLAFADSLLHGDRPETTRAVKRGLFEEARVLKHAYASEDAEEAKWVLEQRYYVVVGNPPYITPKDAALNAAYRQKYATCHRKYSLGVPFTERFFDLALGTALEVTDPGPVGYVGMITANSFMKREFGKKLIEDFLSKRDLTHVIDTSGGYIPGHGTPTVILFARHRPPRDPTIRAALGIRGEPSAPDDPARGRVWREIVEHLEQPGFTGNFVSVSDFERERLVKHPMPLGGGGAAELKEFIDERAESTLETHVASIGFGAILGEDDAFGVFPDCPKLRDLPRGLMRPLVEGDLVRDWSLQSEVTVAFPYDDAIQLVESPELMRWLWPLRTVLGARLDFSKRTYRHCGRPWYEYHQIPTDRNRTPFSIAFADIATHNHFVLDRGGKVFNRTSPVIKLPMDATEADHLALLGLLNSSTACFWLKQVCQPKGSSVHDVSTEKGRPEKMNYAFAGSRLRVFPVPDLREMGIITRVARELDELARLRSASEPRSVIEAHDWDGSATLASKMIISERQSASAMRRMVALQEELDWETYKLFGLSEEGANEVVLADASCGVDPAAVPALWGNGEPNQLPPKLATIYLQRKVVIKQTPDVALIETHVFKRRWLGRQGVFGHNSRTFSERVRDAYAQWLRARLEDRRYWAELQLVSCAQLADRIREDAEFLQVAELYSKRADFDLTALVTELVRDEAAPYLPKLRYRESGLRKRALWEKTWELQRREDAGEKIGPIDPPPRYAQADFVPGPSWRLRGKLDVPKERFVLYPGAEFAGDATPVITWAGFDHREQAQALAARYVAFREGEAPPPERLMPLLAGLDQLVPWLKHWHNEPDAASGQRLGDYFQGFIEEEARRLGKTLAEIRDSVPPTAARRRKKKGDA